MLCGMRFGEYEGGGRVCGGLGGCGGYWAVWGWYDDNNIIIVPHIFRALEGP